MGLSWTFVGWLLWGVVALAVGGTLAERMWGGDERIFLPGDTTHGHYQIELSCTSCHTAEGGVEEQACIDCHQADLDAVNDSHPKKKIKDIRKAHLLEKIDAMSCLTCHQEHVPERTHADGLTVPVDYCVHCHEDIATERPTHADLGFETCTTAGCHNYHDNSALYYEFLKKHAEDAPFKADAQVLQRDFASIWHAAQEKPANPGSAADAPAGSDPEIIAKWLATAHGQAGISCAQCHEVDGEWRNELDHTSCAQCHQHEVAGWLGGLHGMRLAAGLKHMTPGDARLPMHPKVHSQALDCTSCHGSHDFDTTFAAVDACMSCHTDEHTSNYLDSAHYELWRDEVRGVGQPGTGVSCATCHMPRTEHNIGGGEIAIRVEHNQSRYLSPNEKMIRTSCINCHGLGFAIDALADPELIHNNFSTSPHEHIPSIDWVLDHEQRTARPATTTGR